MADEQPPAFLFAHVRKKPRTQAAYAKIAAIGRQITAIKVFANKKCLALPVLLPGVTTYRQAAFVDDEAFKSAVDRARRSGHPIWIADVSDLLRRTDPDKLKHAFDRLDNLGVDILDCVHDRLWSEISSPERMALIKDAAQRKLASGVLKNAVREPQAGVTNNGLLGAGANHRKAIRNANALDETIKAFRTSLPPEISLTPSMVMHHLNAIGLKPPRAEIWSLNGCKNLLKRLEEERR
ncbi:hypothetical protein U8Q05_25800 [Rhizobium ruizarguesonis]|nr:hypothetical protein U8Q05_25800 [Rhizobium ruizarguesonis]